MSSFSFSLVSPERQLYAGEAEAVQVPGVEGLFEVQAGHAPFMSTLSPGLLVIRTKTEEKRFYVRGGFADVTVSGLTVLAEVAIPEEELSGDQLAKEKAVAQGMLADEGDPEDRLQGQRAEDVLAAY